MSHCLFFYFSNLHNTLFLAFVCTLEKGVEYPQIPGFSSAGISVEVHRRQVFSTFSFHFSQLSVFVLHWLRCQRRPLPKCQWSSEQKRPCCFSPLFSNLPCLCRRHLCWDVLSLSPRRSGLSASQGRPIPTAVIRPQWAEYRQRQEDFIPDGH